MASSSSHDGVAERVKSSTHPWIKIAQKLQASRQKIRNRKRRAYFVGLNILIWNLEVDETYNPF